MGRRGPATRQQVSASATEDAAHLAHPAFQIAKAVGLDERSVAMQLRRSLILSLSALALTASGKPQIPPGIYWNGVIETAPTSAELNRTIKDHQQWIDSDGQRGSRADLNHRILANFDLEGVNLCGADLEGSVFAGADLRNAIFGFDGLSNQRKGNRAPGDVAAYLPPAPAMLTVTVDGKVVSQSVPGPTDLKGSIMKEAILASADLSYADLSTADLTDADLSNSDLERSDLTRAILEGSRLDGSNMSEADLNRVLFEPSSISSIVGIENAKNLDLVTFAANPDALMKLRKRFEEEGLTEQARKITYAINKRETQLDPRAERWFRDIAFDFTCRYGMTPGRPLRIIALLWASFSIIYLIFTHSGPCFRVRISRLYGTTDKDREFSMWRPQFPALDGLTLKSFGVWMRTEWRTARAMLFFSTVNAFSLGYREFSIGQWMRLLTMREYEVRPLRWVRFLAGVQSLASIYLFALWLLTYFGRPFD